MLLTGTRCTATLVDMVTDVHQALSRNPGTSAKPPGSGGTDHAPTEGADLYRQACPSRVVLDHVADRWTALTIGALEPGPMRFGELKRRMEGISQKMLTQTLRGLERDGLITRTVRPMPLEVHYALTPLGRELAVPLGALRAWSVQNVDRLLQAQAVYDRRRAEEG